MLPFYMIISRKLGNEYNSMGTQIITANFIERMRSSDYQSTSYAFAELIDNSFDAGANIVKIISIEKRDRQGRRYIDEILFCDDGIGMSNDTIDNCLTFAFGTNNNLEQTIKTKKIGKFGMGLPNSSISQCRSIRVFSKNESTKWKRKILDVDELLRNNSTELPTFDHVELPEYFNNVGAIIGRENGTIISWRECDRLDRQYSSTLYKRSEGILGRLFRYHLSNGKKIILETYTFNQEDNSYLSEPNINVAINDPLFLTPNSYMTKILRESSRRDLSISDEKIDPSTYYKKFIIGLKENESLPTSYKLEDHSYKFDFKWKNKTFEFRLKTSIACIDIQKPGIREGGRTKVGGVYGDKQKNGNIYFTRHQREISCGHYGFYTITNENQRWWSLEIDFDADADDLLGVSNTKQGIKFNKTIDEDPSEQFDEHNASLQQAREYLWFKISKKIIKAIKEVHKILNNQASIFENRVIQNTDKPSIPLGTDATIRALKKTDQERQGQFDDEQKSELRGALIEKFPELDLSLINLAIDKFDKLLVRGCVIYLSIEGNNQLYTYSEVRGFLLISINTEHEFYKNIISVLRETRFEAALTAFELLISSLAWEQYEHYDSRNSMEKSRVISDFRVLVGLHLSNYLIDNNIKISKDDVSQVEFPLDN